MPICHHPRSALRRARRRGLTLTELLAASVIMTMIAGALGTLALTVQSSSAYCRGQTAAAQHGRVVLERISLAVTEAQASEEFPGCIVLSETVGGYDFPDTLVVWRPLGAAANPAGRPLVRELLVFCPDPSDPSRLVELRHTSNSITAPAVSSTSSWRTLVSTIKANAAQRTELTSRLRTAVAVSGSTSPADRRGVIRFQVVQSPTVEQWAEYRAGTRTWQNIDWPLDAYGSQVGLRSTVCQYELQLRTGESENASLCLPFFGSASLISELRR